MIEKGVTMRYGFTTGSCAAAAAKAAAWMLLFGKRKEKISIITPKGIAYEPIVEEISISDTKVSCAVRKDGGDDPDITTGSLIFAEVSYVFPEADTSEGIQSADISKNEQNADIYQKQRSAEIFIDGGVGVGRVTRPGLDQPVGNAAINHVPREMITREVLEVCMLADFHSSLRVTISVPEGVKLASRTFNPRLGIVGGISILGTTGIVEPMSTKAIIDTIRVELSQRKALGFDYVAATPGNYGRDYMKRIWHYDIDRSVKCSNFIGDTIDIAADLGFHRLLLTGHIGKLAKVSGGIMNTHSREGDCRMELIASAAILEGASADTAMRILGCLVTEEALRILQDEGLLRQTMNRMMDKIMFYLRKRADSRLEIECVMYSSEFGELARSKGAEEWLILLAQEQEPRI